MSEASNVVAAGLWAFSHVARGCRLSLKTRRLSLKAFFLIMLHIERWGLLAVWLVVDLQRPRKTKHICTLWLWQNLKACVCLIFEKGIIYSIRFAKPGVPAKCLEASQHPLLDRPLLLDTPLLLDKPLFTRHSTSSTENLFYIIPKSSRLL